MLVSTQRVTGSPPLTFRARGTVSKFGRGLAEPSTIKYAAKYRRVSEIQF